jgi:hypothetical protein
MSAPSFILKITTHSERFPVVSIAKFLGPFLKYWFALAVIFRYLEF